MALQLGALREALVDAGAKPELAREAAEEAAAYENRLAGVERQIVELRAHMDQRFAEQRAEMDQRFTQLRAEMDQRLTEMRADIRLLQWMLGSFGTVILGLLIPLFVKLLIH